AIQPTAKLIIEVDAAANLYISGSNKNVTVDDVFKLYAYYGNQTPEVAWTSSDEDVAEVNSTTGEVTILKAGTATITATAKDANYGSAEFELEATKKRINIKAPAGELVKTYNGERQDINFTSSDIDLEEKGITVSASYVLLTDSGVTEPKQVGTYTVSYEIDDERYTADGNVMLTINKANVVVKAKNISKEYGEEPEYELEIVSGENVADADEMTALAEFASDGAEKTANVGTYDITVTLASNGDENRNFIVSDEKGTLTVTKAPLTVTVKDVTREYGAENPALEAEYEGFKNEETADVLTGELVLAYDESINAETAVGSYSGKTTASGLSSDNYDITFVPGNVAVTKIGVKASAGTSRSSYLTIKLDKAVPGLTANNFVVRSGDENIALTEVTASSDNKTYTLKGSFSTSVTYTVAINLAGTESDATHEIISEPLAIKPSSGSTGGGGGGGGGSSAATTYTVTFETNGGNKIDSVKVSKNGTLSEPAVPTKDGYTFDGWYTDKALKTAYDFSAKVTKNFTLYAKWTEKQNESDKPTEPVEPTEPTTPEWKNPFTDVKENDWYYDNVKYANKNGLMGGTTNTTFAPNEPLTRGMLVAILYRAEGEPAVNKSIPFSEVDTNAYYANAVIWAQQNGIVNGVTENAFAPDDNITREQIAAIMHRYAQYKGYDVSVGESTNILSYTDAESISEYAISAMQYAVGSGLMKGKTETSINPQDNATRAEIAAILQRFL
ncbi:MAG: S-layer homology domain-containing protein, partial [Eubacteriales bacterium]|nr:S-layer homology domain-containing protein [Eubacteriales bacterium]